VSERQPIFKVPQVVVWLLGAFLAVHIVRSVVSDETNAWLTWVLAVVPARLSGLADQIPGGRPAIFTQFVTHIFVHGDLTHLLVNSGWLLAFGTTIARRTRLLPFLAFFLLCGAAGALTFIAFNWGETALVVGASGAISGLMGAAFRYLFRAIGEGDSEGLAGERSFTPLMSLAETLRDRRVLAAMAGWTLLNIMMAWAAPALTSMAGIAWEAHLGGFYFGLLAYGAFDATPGVEQHLAQAE
jgi:membrane associated rhomboid family serine protease